MVAFGLGVANRERGRLWGKMMDCCAYTLGFSAAPMGCGGLGYVEMIWSGGTIGIAGAVNAKAVK